MQFDVGRSEGGGFGRRTEMNHRGVAAITPH